MEIIQKYWYLVIVALVGLFVLARQQSGSTMRQISGSDSTTLALAQIASAEREADETRRFGMSQNFLNYDLSLRQLSSQDSLSRISLSQQIDLARLSADSQNNALRAQFQLASLQSLYAQNQYNSQAELQRYAIQQAYNTQRRNDWLGALSTGIQTVTPYIFGQQTSGNSFPNTPPTFPRFNFR